MTKQNKSGSAVLSGEDVHSSEHSFVTSVVTFLPGIKFFCAVVATAVRPKLLGSFWDHHLGSWSTEWVFLEAKRGTILFRDFLRIFWVNQLNQ